MQRSINWLLLLSLLMCRAESRQVQLGRAVEVPPRHECLGVVGCMILQPATSITMLHAVACISICISYAVALGPRPLAVRDQAGLDNSVPGLGT